MTTLVQISSSQAGKEVTANENFAAVAPAGLFGKKATTTSGLTFGYYGGYLQINGVHTLIADGTVSLTNNATNYIEATRAGTVSANTTGFTAGQIPLFTVVTSAGAQADPTDFRIWVEPAWVGSVLRKAWTSDANLTLTAAEARARRLILTGSGPTTTRDLLVPQYYDAFVRNEISGSPQISIRVRLAGSPSGSGVTIASGYGAFVFADDDDVIRASADA